MSCAVLCVLFLILSANASPTPSLPPPSSPHSPVPHAPSHAPPSTPPPSPPPRQIGFGVYALLWAKGVCKTTTCRTHPPATLLDFTLHGIWPKDSQGKNLLNCAKNYDGNLLQPFIGDMQKYWPSFVKTNEEFWEHEWNKHGTCSGQAQVPFFQNAISLTEQWAHRIMNGLQEKGISPSPTQEYMIQSYLDGIQHAIGSDTIYQIKCGTSASKKYLTEIQICLDNTLEHIIKCPIPAQKKIVGCGKNTDKAILDS